MGNISKELDEILSSESSEKPLIARLNLIGIVRPGAKKEIFEFALGKTDHWVTLPRALVEEIKELGSLEVNGHRYSVVDLIFQRPEKDGEWFDLLAYTLRQSYQLMQEQPSTCCHCQSTDALSPKMKMQQQQGPLRRVPDANPSTFKCFLCWIYTGGRGEMWCWLSGQCG